MWAFGTVIGALVAAVLVASLAWGGPGVLIAVPIVLVVGGAIAVMDFNKRRRQATSIHEQRDRARTEKVHFTERDEQTLASE
jgi:Flp pilus assembly protein TadB